MTPVSIAAYLTLFAGAGFAFLFANLLIGRFLRPNDPHPEKREVYECGEPTIGSSFVQFDLRFYVVALLFIIFDVEVAFFFPWATVFGKSTQLMDPKLAAAAVQQAKLLPGKPESQWNAAEKKEVAVAAEAVFTEKFREMGVVEPTMAKILKQPQPTLEGNADQIAALTGKLAGMSLVDIGAFFAVLMTGFFYVWRRGDLDWVRTVSKQRAEQSPRPAMSIVDEEAPVLSA